MSDNPSGTFGGLLSGLFGGRTNDDGTRAAGSTSGKLVKGALVAAGAAYLYKRYKNGSLNIPGVSSK